jgi:hypothetical protein
MKIQPKISRAGRLDLLAAFSESWGNHFMTEQGDASRLEQLRCSALPYCPTSALVNYAQRGGFRAMDMRMAFYVRVGSAVHEVFQNYLAQTGSLLADYYCPRCKTWFRSSHQYEHCDGATDYHEITLAYKGVHGHIDAVFKDKSGEYWIVDFKTCSLAGLTSKLKAPPAGYYAQVRAYAYLLLKQYGIRVRGVMLMYVPRDNPAKPDAWEMELSDRDFEDIKLFLKGQLRLHKKTMTAHTKEDFLALMAHCKKQDEFCRVCKMSDADVLSVLRSNKDKFPILK